MIILELFFVSIIGLSIGSFATAIIHREVSGQSWAHFKKRSATENPNSQCPKCKTSLKYIDLIPVFSWLWLKGKCRYCKSKVSGIYPLTEISAMICAIIVFIIHRQSSETFFILLTLPFLISLIIIDFKTMLLPNRLVAIVGFIGFARIIYMVYESASLSEVMLQYIGAAFFLGIISWLLSSLMTKMLNKNAMGMGDIKFFFVSGLWLGFTNIALYFILSGITGVLIAIIWKKIKKQNVFPFGPALITSLFVLLLINSSINL